MGNFPISKEKFIALVRLFPFSSQKTLQNSLRKPSVPGNFSEAMLFKASKHSLDLGGPSQKYRFSLLDAHLVCGKKSFVELFTCVLEL